MARLRPLNLNSPRSCALRALPILLLLLAALGPRNALAFDLLHAGFLYDQFDLTLAQGHREEAIGPFFYNEQKETQKTWAIPPLISSMRDPAADVSELDILYPILTCDRYGDQYRYQFCQLFAFAGGPSQNVTNRHRFTIFPIYFQQRASDPAKNYTAVVPFYGHLQKRLFRDEIFFVMFPIYGQSRKKDVVTDNYLFPIFHLRHGDGLHGWQAWPLVGKEHKDVTWQTNIWREPELVPGHDNLFVLWPIFFNNWTGVGTTNLAHELTVLPFYSMVRSPQRDFTTVIWPFFNHIVDRDKKYTEWDAPWPLIEFARGEGKTTTRVWPFFSRAHSPQLESDFYVWPIYKYSRAQMKPLDRKRTRIVFFLFSDTTDKNTDTGANDRRTYLWPFFTYHRDFNGNTRLQVLAILEPLIPGAHKIPRDYSPLWSLWRSEKNPRTGASSQSLLWNLYRRDATPDHKHTSAMFGLFQHESGKEGNQLSLFFIPFGKKTQAPPRM